MSITRIAFAVLPAVLSWESGIWSNIGGSVFASDFIGSLSFQLAFHPDGTPFIAYDDMMIAKRLSVRKFVSALGKWVNVGTPAISQGEVYCLQLKFRSDGTLYVAYTDGRLNVDDVVQVKMFDGESWTSVGNSVELPATSTSQLQFQFGPDETPYIAYVTNQKVEVKKLDGISWVDVGQSGFSIGSVSQAPIQLEFDSTGVPYVSYRTQAEKFTSVVQRLAGVSWTGIGLVGLSENTAYGLKMAFDAARTTVYIGFRDNTNDNKLTVKKIVGSEWISVGSSSDFAAGSSYDEFDLALGPAGDLTGKPVIAYPDSSVSNKLTVKKFEGSSWSALGSPGFSADVPSKIQIRFHSDGTLFLAYKVSGDGTSAPAAVHRYSGWTWVDISVGTFSVASVQFQVILGPIGSPYAVYQDGNNNYKLTVRRFQTSCDASFAPDNGSGMPCTFELSIGRSCVATCDSGYTASGMRTCEVGVILKDTFKCNPLPCNGIEPVPNGITDSCPEFLASGENCTPTCNPGYTPSGVLTCTAGQTSGFQCTPDACDASGVVENGAPGSCGSYLASGDSCTPTCDRDFQGLGARKCLAGTIVDEFECVAFPCDASADPVNGVAFPCSAVLASDRGCVPTCNPGWGPSGSRNCTSGTLLDNFECIHAPCDATSPPSHGHAGNCTKALKSGGTCVPACDSASGLVPSGNRSCFMGVLTDNFECVLPDLSAFKTTTTPSLSPEKAPHRTVSKTSKISLNIIFLAFFFRPN